ncbi:MAG: helix-hairpin-helix domain-containing protein, partial [Clostridia bacterium]
MDEEKITIEGVVENIIFSNEENGYTVCEIISENELFTIVGTMPFLVAGETVKAQGTWSLHPSFGRQFKVECFEKALPADQEAIYKYLSSGSIKGIGPVTAQRIVDRFGEDTFDVLEKNPEWLSEIRGITKKNAEKIAESFASQFGVRSVMLFLNKFFGASISVKIYKKYKSAAIDIVKSNPYRLCSEISGIGFEKADRVAKELGFSNDCDERLESGIKYVLMNSAYQNGHSYLPYSIFISESQKVLSADISAIDNMISFCVQKGEIVRHEYDGHEGYSLLRLFGAESYIAQKLKHLNSNDLPFRLDGIDTQIDILEKSQDIIYHEKQRKAIKFASCYGISVVTGGPGTGKT